MMEGVKDNEISLIREHFTSLSPPELEPWRGMEGREGRYRVTYLSCFFSPLLRYVCFSLHPRYSVQDTRVLQG